LYDPYVSEPAYLRIGELSRRTGVSPELLRALLILPDGRRLQLCQHLAQAFFLGVELKDTP